MNWLEALDLMRAGKIVYPVAKNNKKRMLHKMDGPIVLCRPSLDIFEGWEPAGLYASEMQSDWLEYKPYTEISPQEAFNRLMNNSSVDRLERYSAMLQKWAHPDNWEHMTLEIFMKSKWRYCDEMV